MTRSAGNRLGSEGSLYLRQHAANPVAWEPWDEGSTGRARREGLPVFLSIGYSSCHWCHVMERSAFELEVVAEALNDRFVCIKVDREERPDIDAVYMEAVQAMTGTGGWPLTVFLTPDLRPFHGGTYIPGTELVDVAERVARLFAQQRDRVEERAAKVAAAVGTAWGARPGTLPSAADVDAAAAQAVGATDPVWGGLAGRVKFPMVPVWDWLLERAARGDGAATRAVRATLDGMAAGGLHDHVGGGFHRYSTDPTWSVPHFEKMLYDNAGLARLFARAAVVMDEPAYGAVARDTLDFLLREMAGDDGFRASLDADCGGEEGAFYLWTPGELADVCGAADGATLARLLGVAPAGNFEGRSVPARRTPTREVAQWFGRTEAELDGMLTRWLPALRERRAARVSPGRDPKVVTAWNGMAVAALAEAGMHLGEDRYVAEAARTADALWQSHRRADGSLARATNGGADAGPGVLDDYAHLALGLVAVHRATGEGEWLCRAVGAIDAARERFAMPGGGWYLADAAVLAPLGRAVDVRDHPSSCGQAAMVKALVQAAGPAKRPEYLDEAGAALLAFAGGMTRAWVERAGWIEALAEFQRASNGP